jgi:outer membrane protein TolC
VPLRAFKPLCGIVALWVSGTCWTQAAGAPFEPTTAPVSQGLSFDTALALAQQRASTLDVRRAAVLAAQAQQSSAGQLPDPKLALGVENLPVSGPDAYSLTRDFMTMRRVGWMQDVPNQARRTADVAQAQAQVEREQALQAADRVAVTRETALAWLALYHAQRKQNAFQALERPNQVLLDTVNARVTAGQAQASDALMARQESLSLADRRDEIERDVRKARTVLRRWIGEGADQPLAGNAPTWVDGTRGAEDQTTLAVDVSHHAELRVFEPMKRMAQAELQAAQAEQQGDWGWEIAYSKRGPGYGDMVSFQLRFDLPLWQASRQLPKVRAREQDLQRIEAEEVDATRMHRADVDAQHADLLAIQQAMARLRGSGLPLAHQRADLSLASYQGGRADLSAVLAARRDVAEQQLRLIDLEGQSDALHARLAYLIDLEGADSVGHGHNNLGESAQ